MSIVIPCYNEERYIGPCLDSILASNYPQDRLEVLVVDGMSTDATRAIVEDYGSRNSMVRLIDNPDRIKPKALNVGIQTATGEFVIRMDAHALYDPEYVRLSVRYMDEYSADNVGGIRRTLASGDTIWAKAIGISISHKFAAGNASYRTGATEPKWVDTVFGGCYRRSTFDEIGLFDEELIRGQDREFNIRLERHGGKILLAPDILCDYYARGTMPEFVRWTYVGGMTPFYISRITGQKLYSLRNLVPITFVISLVVLFVLSWFSGWLALLLAVEVAMYLGAALAAAIQVARQEKAPRLVLVMPIIFAMTHVIYGVGSLVGLVKPIRRQQVWSKV